MALIAQLGEHCTGITEVVGSNPAQSLKFFSGLCSSSVTAALAFINDRYHSVATMGQITFIFTNSHYQKSFHGGFEINFVSNVTRFIHLDSSPVPSQLRRSRLRLRRQNKSNRAQNAPATQARKFFSRSESYTRFYT